MLEYKIFREMKVNGIYGRQELKSGVHYEYDALGRRVTGAEYTQKKSSFCG